MYNLTAEQSVKLAKARNYAIINHKNRYGSRPYSYHLDAVNFIALMFELDFEIQVASFLHDIIEDTEITYGKLKMNFGYEIAEMVYDVTDELGRNRKEAKMKTYQKTKRNQSAILLKVCDRCANVQNSIHEHSWPQLRMYIGESALFHKELLANLKNRYNPSSRALLKHYDDIMVSANVIFKKHESNTISITKS